MSHFLVHRIPDTAAHASIQPNVATLVVLVNALCWGTALDAGQVPRHFGKSKSAEICRFASEPGLGKESCSIVTSKTWEGEQRTMSWIRNRNTR